MRNFPTFNFSLNFTEFKRIEKMKVFIFRINAVPRPIPEKKWFMEPWVIVLVGGVLPFGSIFIEMYFIFTSFWAYKIYYVYGFMLLGKTDMLFHWDSFKIIK